ncbi:MAG: YfhO family protein [Gemmatimonadaceae bacterium]
MSAAQPPKQVITADPVISAYQPRFAGLWAALVYAIATMALGWPALAGKFLVGPHSDQYIAGYAFREFAATTLKATGSFPLWNPYQFGGMPFIAAMHGDIFYPTFLLRMVLPTDVAMTWGFMIHVFLAGAFSYLFLRRARFGFPAALVGGLAYMLSGHIATYVSPGHDGKLFVAALFPLLLWAVLAWVRDGRKWALGAIAVAVGLDVLSPHPQLLEYSLLAAGAYAIVLAVGLVRDGDGNSRLAIIRLAAALGAVVVGLAIGAVQFLPVRGYVGWSPRASGIGTYDRATSYAKNPQELLNFYLPEFTGILNHYWGPNGIHYQGDYAGAVVLVLASLGLTGMRSDRRSRELWFWGITVIVALLWALGGATPFYKIPFYLIPGTKYFRAPDSVFFVGTLGIAVFAARGVERALAGEVSRRFVIWWLAFAGAFAVLALTGGLTNFARSVAPEGSLDLVDANSASVVVGAFRSLVFVAVAAMALLNAAEIRKRAGRYAPVAIIAILTALDLFVVNKQYWIFSPPASELYASDAALDYLHNLKQPGRALAVATQRDNLDVALYIGAELMTHRVLNPLGYHGNEIARYNDLVDIPQGGGPNDDSRRLILTSMNVRRLTATQYLLTNGTQLATMIPGLKQVAGPATNDPSGRTNYLYQLPESAPYAWVAPVIVKAPDDAVLATVTDPRFNVQTAALFDPAAPVDAAPAVTALPAPTGIVAHFDSYAPGKMSVTLDRDAPVGSALVVAENYYPGWSATVDGKPAKIGRAQYSMIGVELPAGARKIDLTFTSSSYETGKLITWIAILIALAGLVGGTVLERRQVA